MKGFLIFTGIVTLIAGIIQLVPAIGIFAVGLTAISLALISFALASMASRLDKMESTVASMGTALPAKIKDIVNHVGKSHTSELRCLIESLKPDIPASSAEDGVSTAGSHQTPPVQARTTKNDDGRCTACGYDKLTSLDKACPKCHAKIQGS